MDLRTPPCEVDAKIRANMARDVAVNQQLADTGWSIVRIWDFELERDTPAAVARVRDAIDSAAAHG